MANHLECLATCLLTPQLILSLSDGLRRSMALCLGSDPSLSEHQCLELLQMSNMLLRRASQETDQGLFTKSLRQVIYNLLIMFGEVRKVSSIDIEAYPHVHAGMRVVRVTNKCYQV